MASGQLLDYNTSTTTAAKGDFVQTGDNCVPRPLPPSTWDTALADKWLSAAESLAGK